MEFSNSQHGPQQALCVLLASGNGRGGGDLGDDNLTDDEKALIGSWAGDPVYVAGDYGDPWLAVPEDLKGKTYTTKEQITRDVPGKPGWQSFTGKYKTITHTFGKRVNRDTGKEEDCDENLFHAADTFFEDISDKMITVIAKGESGYHPFAAVDLKATGWRSVPSWGVLPEAEPKKPAGGKKLYNVYKKQAKPLDVDLIESLTYHVRRHPDAADAILALVKTKLTEAKAQGVKEAKEVEARRARGY